MNISFSPLTDDKFALFLKQVQSGHVKSEVGILNRTHELVTKQYGKYVTRPGD